MDDLLIDDMQFQCDLAWRYYYGDENIEINHKTAFDLWQTAAKAGHAESQCALCEMYFDGEGVKRNYKLCLEWAKRAADQNHPRALYILGNAYWTGDHIRKNRKKAMLLIEKSVELGDMLGEYLLAEIYNNGLGVPRNPNVAFVLYKRSSEQDYNLAKYKLGLMYKDGTGVKKNLSKAFSLFEEYSLEIDGYITEDDAEVLYELGLMYKNGMGVKKNIHEALYIFNLLKKVHYLPASYEIGIMYKYGHGVKKKKNYGEKILAKIFKSYFTNLKIDPSDQYLNYIIGCMKAQGDGVKKNLKEAIEYLETASELGYIPANSKLVEIYKNLTVKYEDKIFENETETTANGVYVDKNMFVVT